MPTATECVVASPVHALHIGSKCTAGIAFHANIGGLGTMRKTITANAPAAMLSKAGDNTNTLSLLTKNTDMELGTLSKSNRDSANAPQPLKWKP